jgi:hypothetical protein
VTFLLRPRGQHGIPCGLERNPCTTPSRICGAYLWFVVVSNIYVLFFFFAWADGYLIFVVGLSTTVSHNFPIRAPAQS